MGSEMEDIGDYLKTRIDTDILMKMKVKCSFTMSYLDFLELEKHSVKTGGKFVSDIVKTLKPDFEKIKQALELLK